MGAHSRYAVREVLYCRPGKVRELVARFRSLSGVMQRMGFASFRLLTDMSGERFWTLVAEIEVESLDAFLRMEDEVMADEEARKAMAGYHDLVQAGRREVYRVEG